MSDAFDPPPGDPAALNAAATKLGSVSTDLHTAHASIDGGVKTALSTWRATRADDFRTGAFGIQAQVAMASGAAADVATSMRTYAKALEQTAQDVADLKSQAALVQQHAADQARKLTPDDVQQDMIFQHAGQRQAQLATQALTAKAELATLGGKLAAAIDAQTDTVVPKSSTLTPDEIRRRVDSATGVTGLTGGANAQLSPAQAWLALIAASTVANKILGLEIDNKDGEKPGGPVTALTTDPAILQQLIDSARADGIDPVTYRALLAQYWAVKAAVAAGIDLDGWDPQKGTDGNNKTIAAVYTYYGKLFLNNKDLQWAGMANMIGPSFAAGFLDLDTFHDLAKAIADKIRSLPGPVKDALPPEVRALGDIAGMSGDDLATQFHWYEAKFLAMQKHIFFDQASMHQAYTSTGPDGGLNAIDEMAAAGLIDAPTQTAWRNIDGGDPSQVQTGNTQLLNREQNSIINDQYDQMRNHGGPFGAAFTYAMTVAGSASIPGTKTPGEYSPFDFTVDLPLPSLIPFVHPHGGVHISTPLPDFNVSDKDSRWDYVTHDTLPAYQKLLRDHPDQAQQIIASSIPDRIEQQRLKNRWPQLVEDLVTNWSITPEAGVDVSWWPF